MQINRISDPDMIAGFYEAAADPTQWNRAWTAVCRAFDATTGLLFHQPDPAAAPHILASTNWTGAGPGLFMGGFATRGMSDRASSGETLYRTIVGKEVVSPQAMGQDELYTAFCRPFDTGAFHILGATVPLGGGARAGLGLQRPIDAPAFDEDDRVALDSMTRHLAAALRLAKVLETERMASTLRGAALDRLRHGAVIVSADSIIRFANDAAQRLAEDGGIVLGDIGDRLTCEHPVEAMKLAAIVRGAADGGGGCTRISRDGRQSMLAAVVTPLPMELADAVDVDHTAAPRLALVSLRDLGDTCDAAQTQLMELFGLTSAEAAILPQLLAGDSASLIAQSRGVRVATVRTQVARVLTKTGATNLRALASMVAVLG